MIVLLDADKEGIHFCLRDNDRTIAQGMEREAGLFKKRLLQVIDGREVSMVGYLVRNSRPGAAVPCFGGDTDAVMRELVNFYSQYLADSRHVILGDPDLYCNMPEHARLYAIPFECIEDGLWKCGRNGLVHEWTAKRLALIRGVPASRCITVFLGDSTDVVAFKDGRPVMTSCGFSDFDGILSKGGCGSIDASIVFQLLAAGYSLERIHQVLSQESGFTALLGEPLGFSELIVRDGPKAVFARDILSYQLVKTIGACAAVLEGVDSIAFIGDDRREIQDWVYDFLGRLEFLGLKREKSSMSEGIALTSGDSLVGGYYFWPDKWTLMSGALCEQSAVLSRV